MNKLLSRRGIVLIILPLFVIFVQAFTRFILDKDFNTIGITLGALGIGQLLPYLNFDHFVANKALSIDPEYEFVNGKLIVKYNLNPKVPVEQIESGKNRYFLGTFLNLCLFLATIYLGLTNAIFAHIVTGASCCLITWFLLIFK